MLLEKHGESDVIRDTLEFVLQRWMELETEIRCGTGKLVSARWFTPMLKFKKK